MLRSLSDIHIRTRDYWSKLSQDTARRMKRPYFWEEAARRIQDEERRQVPVRNRASLESILIDLENEERRKWARSQNRPLAELLQKQRNAASKARLPILGISGTRDDLIQGIVQDTENQGKPTKLLWTDFLQKLSTEGFTPREISGNGKATFGCEYRVVDRIEKVSFKTFANVVSRLRPRKESR